MAPDAPAPRFNGLGDPVAGWTVRIDYDEVRDRLTLTTNRYSTHKRPGAQKQTSFPPSDLEDVLARVQVVCRTLNARSLL